MAKQLLSESQIEGQIKNALEDVTFTFSKAAIKYLLWIETLNRFGEDRDNTASYNEQELLGIIEYGDSSSDEVEESSTGALDVQAITVMFNFRDMKNKGLTSGNETLFKPTTDYFVYGGIKYQVTQAYCDGYFNAEPVLVIIKGIRTESYT